MGEVEQKTELDGLIKLIQAKEYAKTSTAVDSPSVNALKQGVKLCTNCNTEHVRGSNWRKHCPANGKKCNDCKKIGHFAVCCKSSKADKEKEKPSRTKEKTPKKVATVSVDEEDTSGDDSNALEEHVGHLFFFQQAEKKVQKKSRQRLAKKKLAEVTSPIPHLVWDNGNWIVRPNKKAPLVSIRYRLSKDGYSAAGRSIPKCRTKTIGSKPVMATIKALADTGCTTMVAGMTFVRQLGLIKEDLLLSLIHI